MTTGPIFVTGASRSGKTLVRWLLSSHSKLVVTRRAEMWPRFAERYGSLGDPANFDRCLHDMLERRQVAWLAPDRERLRRDFALGPPSYARLFALVHAQHAARGGKARWGDQSARYESCIDGVLAAWPDAAIVHVVRDPRDRQVALAEQRRSRPGDTGHATAEWLRSVARARHHALHHPGAYVVVRYEDVVLDPATTVSALCDGLGERYEPAMLRMDSTRRYDAYRSDRGRSDVGRSEPGRSDSETGCPLSASFVGAHREALAAHDLRFIQSIAGDAMTELGYPLAAERLDRADRLRLAAHWPINAVRLGTRRPTPLPAAAATTEGVSA